MPYDKRIEAARFLEDLTASYQGGWYSVISLHGGGSPAAMKQEIWRNYPVGNKVDLVERLLDRGVLADAAARDHARTGSRASAATPAARRRRTTTMVALPRGAAPRERPRRDRRSSRCIDFADFHRRSLDDRDAFWAEQAALDRLGSAVRHASATPAGRRSCAGSSAARPTSATTPSTATSPTRADQQALIYVSTETDQERVYSFAELHAEVQRMAAVLLALGVGVGDRVLIYMPMIPEAVFAMLACARIGAIHSVVFGGFASVSLASRIDDAEPKVVVSADAGSRAGKVIAYKPLLDEAIRLARHKPAEGAAGRSRPGADGARSPDATRTTRALRERHLDDGRAVHLARLRRTRATRSTPAGRPAGRRACSATPAATRSRWPRA